MRAALISVALLCCVLEAAAEFRNNYSHPAKGGFWLWKWEQIRNGVPDAPPGGWGIPAVKADAEALRANAARSTVTWIGHSAFLLQLGGQNILVDPQFSERASPVAFAGPRRIVPLPIEIAELPRIDVVLTSHNHYDHLDLATVRRLAAQPSGSPLFLVPAGLARWFREQGIGRVEEHEWWQSRSAGPVRFTLVPVQHWSKRTLWDDNESLWGGWVIEGAGLKLVHTGDLGYSQDARDVGQRLGPFDLAFIPIGAYAPRWFMRTMHVDVPEAIQVRTDLRAARAIGMHWGTFEGLTDEPMDEPPAELARQRAAAGLAPVEFDVMKIGETRSIEPLQRGGGVGQ
ncbi:MAG TPA: MBL fold metallo-hydrolase [Usitatibacter sp.]|nr:MBL fold metallo-hydrolase [Usitatibacter sp.]